MPNLATLVRATYWNFKNSVLLVWSSRLYFCSFNVNLVGNE